MKLGYELTIDQKQQLSMTPELIQGIKILQLNNMDLFDYVQNELLENPILEEQKPEGNGELEAVEVDIMESIAEDNYFSGDYQLWEPENEEDRYYFEKFTSEEKTLRDFLLEQLSFSKLEGIDKELGKFIIEGLDDNGYLSVPSREIAEILQISEEKFEEVLSVIQDMDPSGVGARNLEECLKIQLRHREQLTDILCYVIDNMLEDVAGNRISKIAKTIGTTPKHTQEIVDRIRGLEPKPGRQFAGRGENTKYVIPDVFLEKVNGEYVLTTNDASIPTLTISPYYKELVHKAKDDNELNQYLSDRFSSAKWLIKSIKQREDTIFNVARAIIGFQKDFFEKGEKHIKPLTLKQIAETLEIHESTVSRAINGKYIQCPMGVFELRYFFSGGVYRTGEDEGLSSNSVKSIIKDIVDGENQKKPFSDQDMVKILKEKGIEISRRTVAKYREEMGILSSSKRRRF
ncbi:MAG: RNA polymerase factor sigma-54 [Hornefia sp.]|nr:RNA polymerase factor sigma-54 [Hornefia sp.]